MDLKFYLNKFLKVDNVEKYSLKSLFRLRDSYDEFLENSKGTDPDFPLIDFGDRGKRVKGVNKLQVGMNGGDESSMKDFLGY